MTGRADGKAASLLARHSAAPDWVLGDSCPELPETPAGTGVVPEKSLAETFTYLFPTDLFSLFWADLSWVIDSAGAVIPVSQLSFCFLHCEEGPVEIL